MFYLIFLSTSAFWGFFLLTERFYAINRCNLWKKSILTPRNAEQIELWVVVASEKPYSVESFCKEVLEFRFDWDDTIFSLKVFDKNMIIFDC